MNPAPGPPTAPCHPQATYARISRANVLYDKIANAPDDDEGTTLSYDEAKEAAEAEEALGVEGLGALLWAAIVLAARPADPGGANKVNALVAWHCHVEAERGDVQWMRARVSRRVAP